MNDKRVMVNNLAVVLVSAALSFLLVGCGQSAQAVAPTDKPSVEPTAADAEPASPAGQPLVIDSNGEVPFYARFGENETFTDGEWTVIVFYRPPECIPADFNLNQFFHFPGENSPGAFACVPPTTRGKEIWKTGPETDPAPLIAELTGQGAVPVWFFANAEMESAAADGIVTITELNGLASRLMGTAAKYTELLHPSQSNASPLIQFMAEGYLDDGRAFKVDVSSGAPEVEDHVTIEIAD